MEWETMTLIEKLNISGEDYRFWSIRMKDLLHAVDLWEYVDGTAVKLSKNTADEGDGEDEHERKLKDWKMHDARAKLCIIRSVEPRVRECVTWCRTAKEMWDSLKMRYLKDTVADAYKAEMDLQSAYQGNRTVRELYGELITLWDQLSIKEPEFPDCCQEKFRKHREKRRLFQLLIALRPEFDGLRWDILRRNPLPETHAAVAELDLFEETRKLLKAKDELNSVRCYQCKEFGHKRNACPWN